MVKKDRLINTFIELATIDSPSGEEETVALHISKKLKNLGLMVIRDKYGNIIAKNPKTTGNPLMLNAHMDTVEPGRGIKPQIKKDRITSDGSTVLGSDPKAGVSIILEALTSIKEDTGKLPSVEVVLTREEETTLGGVMNLDYSKVSAKEGIVFDGDEEVFKIFISSPTYYVIDAEITGRAAHAGVEPEKGISAIEIAAKIINKLQLGRIDEETTCNIGTIQGGSVRNAVPEKVLLAGEIRSRNKKTLAKLVKSTQQAFATVAKEYPEAKIDLQLLKDFEGFHVSPNHPLIKKAKQAMEKLKLQAELKDSGGGSDANIFFTHEIEVIIVGTGVYEPHTTREYLHIAQFFQAAQFCEQFIQNSAK